MTTQHEGTGLEVTDFFQTIQSACPTLSTNLVWKITSKFYSSSQILVGRKEIKVCTTGILNSIEVNIFFDDTLEQRVIIFIYKLLKTGKWILETEERYFVQTLLPLLWMTSHVSWAELKKVSVKLPDN